MIIIILTDCPLALRGDLTKWLLEINTGVYVGKVSARIQEQIWQRVKENAKSGRATMVFTTNNEQGMDFRVHNTSWEPIDFDGLKLMLKPSPARIKKLGELRMGFSKAAKIRKAKYYQQKKTKQLPKKYVVVDLETTGLSPNEHDIIEIGAIKIEQQQIIEKFHALVKPRVAVPQNIISLTGLTSEILQQRGKKLLEVLPDFITFVGDWPVVCHNADFDYGFLRKACENLNLPLFSNKYFDTLPLARRLVDDVPNYKLGTLLNYFGIELGTMHRSMDDCLATKLLYEKLIKIRESDQ